MNIESIHKGLTYRNLSLFLFLAAFHDVLYVYYVNPSGITIDKILFLLSFYFFIKLQNIYSFSHIVTGLDKRIIYVFIFWCLISFFRGIVTGIEENRFQNSFNPHFSLSVIVPFAIFIPFHSKFSFNILYNILINFIKIGLCLMPLTFFIERGYIVARPFIEASFFLLIFLGFIKKNNHRLLIVFGCLCYVLIGVYSDSRSFFLRLGIQMVFLLFISFGEKVIRKENLKKIVTVLCFLVPFLFYTYYDSLFTMEGFNLGGKSVTNEDTRTFMYIEVFEDLEKNAQLMIGKGTLGRYYSAFFYKQFGVDDIVDTYNRSIVEVGILSYLLRGGFVLVGLFTILILKIGVTNLSSRDKVIRGCSYILLNHFLLSFIDNIPKFFVYDIIIWIIVGYMLKSKFIKNHKNTNVSNYNLEYFGKISTQ